MISRGSQFPARKCPEMNEHEPRPERFVCRLDVGERHDLT